MNHRGTEDTEVCHRESRGASFIGNLTGSMVFTAMQDPLRSLSSVFSVPLW
jgi:hypothetical protein